MMGVSRVLRWIALATLLVSPRIGDAQTWIQLNPTGDVPPRAIGPAVAYNPATNRLMLFGGGDTGGPDPQPASSAVRVLINANGLGGAAIWAHLTVTGAEPLPRRFHSIAYDQQNNRLIVFGGGTVTHAFSPTYNDVWVLTNADGTGGPAQWIQLHPTSPLPAARSFFGMGYDPVSNRLVIFGGYTGFTFLNDAWVLTNANGLGGAPQWTQLQPAGVRPSARNSFGASYDDVRNRLIVHGAHPPGPSNETWVLANSNGLGGTPAWTKLNVAGAIDVYGITSGYDPSTNRLMYFSGGRPPTAGYPNADAMVLTEANGLGGASALTALSVAGVKPPGREGYGAAYDPLRNRLIIFGGNPLGGQSNDLWVLTNANGFVDAQLSIDQVIPASGGNAGQVTVQVIGTGIEEGARVTLSGPGPDISGNDPMFIDGVLTSAFDLVNAPVGPWDIQVLNPNGNAVTLAGGFQIIAGGAPELWVDVLSRSLVRFASETVFYLRFGNRGTVDAKSGLVLITIPKPTLVTAIDDGIGGTVSTGETTELNVLSVSLDSVPAGSQTIAPLLVTLPNGAPPFGITARIKVAR